MGDPREAARDRGSTGTSGTEAVVVAPSSGREVRAAADVLRLAVAALVLLGVLTVEALVGDTLVEFSAELLNGLSAVPDWLLEGIVLATRGLATVFLLGGAAVAAWQGRWRFLVAAAVAGVLAAGLFVLSDAVAADSERALVEVDAVVPAEFPTAVGLAAVAAVVTAAAPWLTRRWRRVGWVLVVGAALCRFLVSDVQLDSWRALSVGWFAGSVVLVALGAPSRRPSGTAVARGLAEAGVPLARLEQAGVDARGSTPYFAITPDERRLFVKALGADERAGDLLFRLYRRVVPRALGDERQFSSLRRAVEHEALVALAARDRGVRTPRFVALAHAEPNGFVLAYEAIEGDSLDRVDADDLTDGLLASLWRDVRDLHGHRIAHRDLRLANVFRARDGSTWLIDFGFSELAASDLLVHTDLAELLTSTATRVGADRAVAAAATILRPEDFAGMLERLHAWALSGATRTALKEAPELLPDLRQRVDQAAGGVDASTR